MEQIISRIKKRIKNTKGMSIGEILVAVLIMLLATVILTSTVTLGVNHYFESLRGSESNELYSTLQSIITSELAYTTEIHVADSTAADKKSNLTEFQSQNYAIEGSLSMFFTSNPSDYSEVMIGDADGDPKDQLKLLGSGSYPNHIGVKINSIEYDWNDHIFTINLSIGYGSRAYIDKQIFQVININNTDPS